MSDLVVLALDIALRRTGWAVGWPGMSRHLPFHLQEPQSCGRCMHSFYSTDDTAQRYLRCGRSVHAGQCRYERHETGNCGPAATNWKERAA